MYLIVRDELVAQHVADLHRQAASHRLVLQLLARRRQARRRRGWGWPTFRRPRPATAA